MLAALLLRYISYEEEDTCMSYEEEDTCMTYEEEDTCMPYEEEDTCCTPLAVYIWCASHSHHLV